MKEEVLDCSLDDFINFLFERPPMPKNQVIFDWFAILEGSTQPIDDLFQGLLEIWTKGMARLFGDMNSQVDLDSLSIDNVQLIEQYFNSMGFTIYYQRTSKDNPNQQSGRWPPPTPAPNQSQDRLNTRVLTLNTSNAVYEICFDTII